LGQGIAAALAGELAPLAPIAPAGPIRLQGRRLAGEIASASSRTGEPALPLRGDELEVRDRIAILLADHGFVPRLGGTLNILGRRLWVFGFENVEAGRRPSIGLTSLTPILRKARPTHIGEYDAVALARCSGPILDDVISVRVSAMADILDGRSSEGALLRMLDVKQIGRPLIECVEVDRPDSGQLSGIVSPAPMDAMSTELDQFIADVHSGFHSNWLSVLTRTIGGRGMPIAQYRESLDRVRRVAEQVEHSARVDDAQRRVIAAARPVICQAMAELSEMDPEAKVTETQRIQSCEHFTRWAAAAIVLDGKVDTADRNALLDPFLEIRGCGRQTCESF
jgi:hypothetical protein